MQAAKEMLWVTLEAALPPEEFNLLLMRYHGYSLAEIAQKENVSTRTMERRWAALASRIRDIPNLRRAFETVISRPSVKRSAITAACGYEIEEGVS